MNVHIIVNDKKVQSIPLKSGCGLKIYKTEEKKTPWEKFCCKFRNKDPPEEVVCCGSEDEAEDEPSDTDLKKKKPKDDKKPKEKPVKEAKKPKETKKPPKDTKSAKDSKSSKSSKSSKDSKSSKSETASIASTDSASSADSECPATLQQPCPGSAVKEPGQEPECKCQMKTVVDHAENCQCMANAKDGKGKGNTCKKCSPPAPAPCPPPPPPCQPPPPPCHPPPPPCPPPPKCPPPRPKSPPPPPKCPPPPPKCPRQPPPPCPPPPCCQPPAAEESSSELDLAKHIDEIAPALLQAIGKLMLAGCACKPGGGKVVSYGTTTHRTQRFSCPCYPSGPPPFFQAVDPEGCPCESVSAQTSEISLYESPRRVRVRPKSCPCKNTGAQTLDLGTSWIRDTELERIESGDPYADLTCKTVPHDRNVTGRLRLACYHCESTGAQTTKSDTRLQSPISSCHNIDVQTDLGLKAVDSAIIRKKSVLNLEDGDQSKSQTTVAQRVDVSQNKLPKKIHGDVPTHADITKIDCSCCTNSSSPLSSSALQCVKCKGCQCCVLIEPVSLFKTSEEPMRYRKSGELCEPDECGERVKTEKLEVPGDNEQFEKDGDDITSESSSNLEQHMLIDAKKLEEKIEQLKQPVESTEDAPKSDIVDFSKETYTPCTCCQSRTPLDSPNAAKTMKPSENETQESPEVLEPPDTSKISKPPKSPKLTKTLKSSETSEYPDSQETSESSKPAKPSKGKKSPKPSKSSKLLNPPEVTKSHKRLDSPELSASPNIPESPDCIECPEVQRSLNTQGSSKSKKSLISPKTPTLSKSPKPQESKHKKSPKSPKPDNLSNSSEISESPKLPDSPEPLESPNVSGYPDCHECPKVQGSPKPQKSPINPKTPTLPKSQKSQESKHKKSQKSPKPSKLPNHPVITQSLNPPDSAESPGTNNDPESPDCLECPKVQESPMSRTLPIVPVTPKISNSPNPQGSATILATPKLPRTPTSQQSPLASGSPTIPGSPKSRSGRISRVCECDRPIPLTGSHETIDIPMISETPEKPLERTKSKCDISEITMNTDDDGSLPTIEITVKEKGRICRCICKGSRLKNNRLKSVQQSYYKTDDSNENLFERLKNFLYNPRGACQYNLTRGLDCDTFPLDHSKIITKCSLVDVATVTSGKNITAMRSESIYNSSVSQEMRCTEFSSSQNTDTDTEERTDNQPEKCLVVYKDREKEEEEQSKDSFQKKSEVDIKIEINDKQFNLHFREGDNETNLTIRSIGRCSLLERVISSKDPRIIRSQDSPVPRILPPIWGPSTDVEDEKINQKMSSFELPQLELKRSYLSSSDEHKDALKNNNADIATAENRDSSSIQKDSVHASPMNQNVSTTICQKSSSNQNPEKPKFFVDSSRSSIMVDVQVGGDKNSSLLLSNFENQGQRKKCVKLKSMSCQSYRKPSLKLRSNHSIYTNSTVSLKSRYDKRNTEKSSLFRQLFLGQETTNFSGMDKFLFQIHRTTRRRTFGESRISSDNSYIKKRSKNESGPSNVRKRDIENVDDNVSKKTVPKSFQLKSSEVSDETSEYAAVFSISTKSSHREVCSSSSYEITYGNVAYAKKNIRRINSAKTAKEPGRMTYKPLEQINSDSSIYTRSDCVEDKDRNNMHALLGPKSNGKKTFLKRLMSSIVIRRD